MWVHPAHRRRGAGRAMIVAAADARDGLPLAGHQHSNYSAGGIAAVSSPSGRLDLVRQSSEHCEKFALNRFKLHVFTKELVQPMFLEHDTPPGQ